MLTGVAFATIRPCSLADLAFSLSRLSTVQPKRAKPHLPTCGFLAYTSGPMPAAADPALVEAVKAHAIIHGIRPACEHFKLPVSTVGSWSERDPAGPWCPKRLPAVVRPATLRPANNANTPSQAALTARERQDAKAHAHGRQYVGNQLRYAAKVSRNQPELGMAIADKVNAVASVAQKANMAGWERQTDRTAGSLVNIAILGVHPDQLRLPECNPVETQ